MMKVKTLILFATEDGSTKKIAVNLESTLKKHNKEIDVNLLDLGSKDFDPDDYLIYNNKNDENEKKSISPTYAIFIVPTYYGEPPKSAKPFKNWLKDIVQDFRVQKDVFENLRFCVFGVGNSVFCSQKNSSGYYNSFAKFINKSFSKFTAKRMMSLTLCDNSSSSYDPDEKISKWIQKCERILLSHEQTEKQLIKNKKNKKIQKNENDDNNDDDEDEDEDEDIEDIVDIEKSKNQKMLTPKFAKIMKKQGYKLFGENQHSAVKLCRWSKAQIRGRGACYKHTAYGITSYHCMEMSPSIACANKCVFCWRHHNNPLTTEWRWKYDEPEKLIDESIKNHKMLIKELKGVPGVIQERYEDGMKGPKHCALSLIGEPIIYPEINKFIDLLHKKNISTFLVTNSQFPDRIKQLKPVTQLYLSIDAPTKEALKKVDRPIFSDYWDRFLKCIDLLKNRKERTVFRFTLIKSWNMNCNQDLPFKYSELIKRGKPDFVEVKGVTFSGNAKEIMKMKNVPYYEEIVKFAKAILNQKGMEEYDIAVGHKHTLFVLIAKKKFKDNGVWKTWIDNEKFFNLVNSGKDFSATDYMKKTPDWAVFGAKEIGFDPKEKRYQFKNKK